MFLNKWRRKKTWTIVKIVYIWFPLFHININWGKNIFEVEKQWNRVYGGCMGGFCYKELTKKMFNSPPNYFLCWNWVFNNIVDFSNHWASIGLLHPPIITIYPKLYCFVIFTLNAHTYKHTHTKEGSMWVESRHFGIRHTWFRIFILRLADCVTLDKLPKLSLSYPICKIVVTRTL